MHINSSNLEPPGATGLLWQETVFRGCHGILSLQNLVVPASFLFSLSTIIPLSAGARYACEKLDLRPSFQTKSTAGDTFNVFMLLICKSTLDLFRRKFAIFLLMTLNEILLLFSIVHQRPRPQPSCFCSRICHQPKQPNTDLQCI